MFETEKYGFYVERMRTRLGSAMEAKEQKNDGQALLKLKEAMQFANKAIGIQSEKINEQQKTALSKSISLIKTLYQKELFAQMPGNDRELILSVLKHWADMGVVTIGGSPLEPLIGMFDVAKNHLGDEKEVLSMIYEGNRVPLPLRKIMQPFLAGEATPEETVVQLDNCTSKLKKYLPEFLLEELTLA